MTYWLIVDKTTGAFFGLGNLFSSEEKAEASIKERELGEHYRTWPVRVVA